MLCFGDDQKRRSGRPWHHPLWLVACALAWQLFPGCGRTTTHFVLSGSAGPVHEGNVALVLQGQPPPEGLEEVALLQAVGSGIHADMEHVVQGLVERARSLGCNAIVNVKIDQGASHASGTGVCLRPPGPSVPPPTPESTF